MPYVKWNIHRTYYDFPIKINEETPKKIPSKELLLKLKLATREYNITVFVNRSPTMNDSNTTKTYKMWNKETTVPLLHSLHPFSSRLFKTDLLFLFHVQTSVNTKLLFLKVSGWSQEIRFIKMTAICLWQHWKTWIIWCVFLYVLE